MPSNQQTLDIIEAAEFLNYTPQYIRALVRTKKIKTTQIPIVEGARVLKHIITMEELKRFQATRGTRTRRKDGRNKFILYARPQEYPKILKALKAADLEVVADLITLANPKKPKKTKKKKEDK
jgi:hypothetical protein